MKVTIDHQILEAGEGKTLLEIARESGIYIPSLCDHPRLYPFGGCRLCLVEIKGRKGYAPACSTFVEDGMEVITQKPELLELRKEILELILSEHPHACLICSEKSQCEEYKSTIRKVGEVTGCVFCPNNGRCELQEVVEALKIEKVRFPALYRNLDVCRKDPFFDRNYNLCILCGRCVRICHEVRGVSALTFAFRGFQTLVGTPLDKSLIDAGCQFCGACVDVCPTGALTERAIRSEGLPDDKKVTICPLCSLGCEVVVEIKYGKILATIPSEIGAVNKGQACVKGRFTIKDIVYSPKRILKPLIRKNGHLEEVNWEEALDFASKRLGEFPSEEIGLLFSPQHSLEEMYVFQKFAHHGLKTGNWFLSLDFSLHLGLGELFPEDHLTRFPNFAISDVKKAKTIVLFGSGLASSHPILWLEIFEALKKGSKLVLIHSDEEFLTRFASLQIRLLPGKEGDWLFLLSKILSESGEFSSFQSREGFSSFQNFLHNLPLSRLVEKSGISEKEARRAAQVLLTEKPVVFLMSPHFFHSCQKIQMLSVFWNLALLLEAKIFALDHENNIRGAYQSFSASSHLSSFPLIKKVQQDSLRALFLASPLPFSLEKAKLEFLVIQDSFLNPNMKFADVIFPATTFAETEGTFVNLEGRWQKFSRVIEPLGEAKPDWWIVSQLARRMGFSGFLYEDAQQIEEEISLSEKPLSLENEVNSETPFFALEEISAEDQDEQYPFLLYAEYSSDYYKSLSLADEIRGLSLLRNPRWVKLHPEDARELSLEEGDKVEVESDQGMMEGMVKISEAIPRGVAKITFLMAENPAHSAARVFGESLFESRALQALPVRIRKGRP